MSNNSLNCIIFFLIGQDVCWILIGQEDNGSVMLIGQKSYKTLIGQKVTYMRKKTLKLSNDALNWKHFHWTREPIKC